MHKLELSGDAEAILEEYARPFLDAEKGVDTSLEAYAGASDIVAEAITEDANVRGSVRSSFFKRSALGTKLADPDNITEKDPTGTYQLYYDFNEDVTKLVPHRILALNRAEREGIVRISVDLPYEQSQVAIKQHYPVKETSRFARLLADAMEDGYK